MVVATTVGGPAVYPEGARVVFPQHRGGLLETTARKDLVDGLAQVREDPQPDPTKARLKTWPAASTKASGGWHAGRAWHDTMWSAPRGKASPCRRSKPAASPCPPRTPSKSAADAGHGHADHTPGGHDPLRTSRSRVGWAECRPGTDRCSLPLPYLRTGTAPGTEPRRVGNWDRSDGLPPVLSVTPGFFTKSSPS